MKKTLLSAIFHRLLPGLPAAFNWKCPPSSHARLADWPMPFAVDDTRLQILGAWRVLCCSTLVNIIPSFLACPTSEG